jgi:predicted DNA-binding protein (UPF0251 family)
MGGRPKKKRTIGWTPRVLKFSPRGIIGRPDITYIDMDGAEAMRLAHIEGLDHTEAALRMNVSRQTFDRVLDFAHRALADGIINGKIISIKEMPIVESGESPKAKVKEVQDAGDDHRETQQ